MTRVGAARDEHGFVLPVAVFVMVLLLMIATVGLYSARSDYRAAAATRDAAVALAAADAGAARTLATWTASVPSLPAPGDSLVLGWQQLPDGSLYRIVVFRAPVGPTDPPGTRVMLYSTGRSRPPQDARRTIVMTVEPGSGGAICCDAALKVQSTLVVMGSSGADPVPEVDGADRAPPGWPGSRCANPPADEPGVATSNAATVLEWWNGDIEGSPPVEQDPTIDASDFSDLGGMTYADLVAMADISFGGNQTFNNQIRPRVRRGQCNTNNNRNWGDPLDPGAPCGDYAPIVHVGRNLRLRGNGSGQGILLVDGDLTIQNNFTYYGIIIVQGRVWLSDNTRIVGGLMVRGGPTGGAWSVIMGRAKVAYSSCAVDFAQSALPGGSSTRAAPGRSWFEVIG